ncbi:MAG TPA: hypothetical protein VHI77_00375 [Solirubrobacterales bacterium]|jgi:hypothetical protein|nr:hypothetical protein [Solirubrobacterales bacterium]
MRGLAVSVALVVAAVVLAIVGGSGGEPAAGIDTTPRFVDASALGDLEGSLEHQIYWAGERPGFRLELKEEAEGSVYLRYLPPGVEAGDPEQRYLTVGTYPVLEAVAALRRASARSGVPLKHLDDGGVVLPNAASAGSVYIAYPGSDLQIEVYDPTPGESLRLIRAGAIGPVG